jgi:hypothetical protein
MKQILPMVGLLFSIVLQQTANAHSFGSPRCEITSLPVTEMSASVANPAPTGWQINSTGAHAWPGRAMTLRVTNTDPAKQARGVLVWARRNGSSPSGSFQPDAAGLFQWIPTALGNCGEASISHTGRQPKNQAQLTFEWTPDAVGTSIVRAFIIEDCGAPETDCRAWQALTPVHVIPGAVFVDGLESP